MFMRNSEKEKVGGGGEKGNTVIMLIIEKLVLLTYGGVGMIYQLEANSRSLDSVANQKEPHNPSQSIRTQK